VSTAHAYPRDDVTVEADVVRTLYGDPSQRRLARATQTRFPRAREVACEAPRALEGPAAGEEIARSIVPARPRRRMP
jgi:hypothetical protein